jgi:hypothetical protein
MEEESVIENHNIQIEIYVKYFGQKKQQHFSHLPTLPKLA